MEKRQYIIGIDPDLKASGVAVYCRKSKKHYLYLMSFMHLCDFLKVNAFRIETLYVEAGWLNPLSNFHTDKEGKQYSQRIGQRIAKNVGQNHASGILISEACQHFKIPFELIRPTTAKWIPQNCLVITKIKLNNQECIDALKLIYGRI